MSRKYFGDITRTVLVILAGLLTLGAESESIAQKAARLHKEAIVIDTHVDTLQRVLYEGIDLGIRLPSGQVDIPRLREGGMSGVFFAVWVDSVFKGQAAVQKAERLIDAMVQTVRQNPHAIELALTAADVDRIRKSHKVAALMGIEGGHAINDDLSQLAKFHQRGVRYMTLTWANNTNWADSSGDKRRHGGLTDFGRQVVREMNRLGMMVDISHVSDETFYDTLKVTKKPVIASHSSCRALADVRRNMTDDMIRALAKNGGVIGINFYSGFLDTDFNRQLNADKPARPATDAAASPESVARARYQAFITMSKLPPLPLSRLIDHIDHVVKLVGPNHVGLGSDFDGIDAAPAGIEDVSKLPNITRALLERGYRDQDIKKILGGNFMRVLKAVTGS
ncbi:MAG: membrane dipeptidase [Acidobacteria bacterium]|nr:membrane dipeptidase [Acidobacteriota bacterium]MBI3658497.1 membrane dipeptidase [Acidobacteriota bacterium]